MAKKRSMDIKGLLLAHVEKLACVVIAVCFVLLLWGAFSRKGVEAGLEPEDISAAVQRARITITSTTWENFSDKPQMRNFAQESGWYDVPMEPYMLTTPWDPPLWPKQDLRDDPKYYPIQELEAHFDQGPFALYIESKVRQMFDPPQKPVPAEVEKQLETARERPPKFNAADAAAAAEGGGTAPEKIKIPGVGVDEIEVSEGRRWIMVTGLLPWQEQIDAYLDKFRAAAGYDQKADLPYYFGYEVERADVTGGVEPVWESYDKIFPRTLFYSMIRWAPAKRSEIIAKANEHSIFTWPLGPRVLELWGTRDKHSKIPLQLTAEEKEADVATPMTVDDPLGGLGEPMETTTVQNNDKNSVSHIAYKMLRYYDFGVEPGHAYQYRFRVAIRDPNYVRSAASERELQRVELKLLEEHVVKRINDKRAALEKEGLTPELADRYMPVVYTEWSDPSPLVKVPPDVYILALDSKFPRKDRFNEEPVADLLVTKYDKTLGVEVGAGTTLQRGNIANFSGEVSIINVDHSTLETRELAFPTNNMLIDVRGGSLNISTGEIVEASEDGGSIVPVPTEMLLLDLDRGGKLIVADSVEDAESVHGFRKRKADIEALKPKADQKGGGPPVGVVDESNLIK